MNWNDHSNLRGKHALLSPSKHYWSDYDEDQLHHFIDISDAAERGTKDHEFAALCIDRRQRLPKSRNTLTMYVNDAIGFRMDPEVCLYFSDNCYGWTDAIVYDDRTQCLRIFDLKTGAQPASMKQLEIYAALYCLEYKKRPEEMRTILRIYQSADVNEEEADPKDIRHLMNVIIRDDRIIEKRKAKG